MTEGVTQSVRQLAGRYQIGDRIGRGGMSDVHVGTDARLSRKVAIKLLKPSLATDPVFRTRFRQEAQAAARMAHPTIVRVFDAGEETIVDDDGNEVQLPFIVMEHVDGRLLRDIIAEGPIDPREAVRIIEGVLTALEYSHRAGVVHRDIKPGNIMVARTGQVKVMDFGIARAISDSAATVAETSAILGTAQYFSPEQARGETVDARTDLYSTGIVLFEMLTGRPPFRGDTPVAVAYQHVSEAPVPPSAFNPRVSPALDAVVLHALAKDRFERFQSAAEFRSDVEVAAAGHVPDRKPDSDHDFHATLFGVNPSVVAGQEATIRQLTVEADDPRPSSQTRPPVAWIWAGVTVMAVVVAAVLFWTFNLTPTSYTDRVSVLVPDVAGQDYETGAQALQDRGLQVQRLSEVSEDVEAGMIVHTDPDGGLNVSPGSPVRVYVSLGPTPIATPQVDRMEEQAAIDAITGSGLSYGSTTLEHSPSVKAGVVIRTDPVGGTQLHEGDIVNLVVSDGLVTVPSVIGQPVADAGRLLGGSQYQLQVRVAADWSCAGGAVSKQSYAPDSDQPQKSEITIHYCAD